MGSLVDLAYSINLQTDTSAFSNIVQSTQQINQNMSTLNTEGQTAENTLTEMANTINTANTHLRETSENANDVNGCLENMTQGAQNINQESQRTNGIYRDVNGRLRDANGRFISMTQGARGVNQESQRTNGIWRDANGRLRDANGRFITMRNNVRGLNREAQGATNTFKGLAKVITGAFVAKKVMDFGKASVKTFVDFEQGMADVKATMGNLSQKDFKLLQDAAMKAGATTKFTATQAAEALKYEALAGWSAANSAKALPTMLNLAAAGNMELKQTTDMVTDAMAPLKLSFDQLEMFTDQLARTSQRSNTNIDQLGEALLVAGGTAKNAGMDLTSINTELGILADSNYKGAKGGTALRNVLLNITSNDKVHDFMTSLGVKTADASGKIRPMNDILLDLRWRLSKMTESQRMASLAVIGGKENVQGLNILLQGAGKRYEELSKQIKNSKGATKAMADEQNSTVRGALLSLSSAIEGVQLKFMMGVNKSELFRKILLKLTDALPKVSNFFAKIGHSISKFANFLIKHKSVVVPAIKAIGIAFAHWMIIKTVTSVVNNLKGVLTGLKVALGLFTSPIGLVVAGVALLVGGFIYAYKHSEKFRKQVHTLWGALQQIASFIMSYVVPVIVGAFGSLFESAKAIFKNISQVIGGIVQTLSGVIDFIAGVFTGNWSRAWDGIKGIFVGIWESIKGTFKGVINFISSGINTLLGGISKIHFKVPEWVPGVGGKEIGFPQMQIPRLAGGTQSWMGGIARINDEYGGEIVEMPGGSKVYPHDQSIHQAREDGKKEATRGGAANVKIQININGANNPQEIAKTVRKEIENIFGSLNLQLGYGSL